MDEDGPGMIKRADAFARREDRRRCENIRVARWVEVTSAGSSVDVVFGGAARACSSGVVLDDCKDSIHGVNKDTCIWDKKSYQNPPEEA